MRESVVEAYLVAQVKARGGEIRKVRWIGRRGAPDRYVLLPDRMPAFIELKRPGLDAAEHQAREHARLRGLNATVLVLDTIEKIDHWLGQEGVLRE
jgi:hypothetical protein